MSETAKAALDAFWQSCGEDSVEAFAPALLAAYELGDEKEFGDVLCEVSTSGLALETLTAFMRR